MTPSISAPTLAPAHSAFFSNYFYRDPLVKNCFDVSLLSKRPRLLQTPKGKLHLRAVNQCIEEGFSWKNIFRSISELFFAVIEHCQAIPQTSFEDALVRNLSSNESYAWIYGIDGCVERAALAAEDIERTANLTDDLFFKALLGPNIGMQFFDGQDISWNFHVAIALEKDNKNTLVIDPAIDSKAALQSNLWVQKIQKMQNYSLPTELEVKDDLYLTLLRNATWEINFPLRKKIQVWRDAVNYHVHITDVSLEDKMYFRKLMRIYYLKLEHLKSFIEQCQEIQQSEKSSLRERMDLIIDIRIFQKEHKLYLQEQKCCQRIIRKLLAPYNNYRKFKILSSIPEQIQL